MPRLRIQYRVSGDDIAARRPVLIQLPESNGYVVVAVEPHDDAYTYAGKLRFGVSCCW